MSASTKLDLVVFFQRLSLSGEDKVLCGVLVLVLCRPILGL